MNMTNKQVWGDFRFPANWAGMGEGNRGGKKGHQELLYHLHFRQFTELGGEPFGVSFKPFLLYILLCPQANVKRNIEGFLVLIA